MTNDIFNTEFVRTGVFLRHSTDYWVDFNAPVSSLTTMPPSCSPKKMRSRS